MAQVADRPSTQHRSDSLIRRTDVVLDALVTRRSIGQLLGAWLWMALGAGVLVWLAELSGQDWLAGTDAGVSLWRALSTSIYFSFVSALSIGYGDIVPLGPARVIAIVEGAAGLLIFGCVISKLVSRRQEALLEETHRIAFEDRLGRVRTNLHLVLAELQTIAGTCAEHGEPAGRTMSRAESAAAVFGGELQAIHDLLYRPQQEPDEQVLESILANVTACMEALVDLLGYLPPADRHSQMMGSNLRHINGIAVEICAECVPRQYAPDLAAWMDRIRELADTLEAARIEA